MRVPTRICDQGKKRLLDPHRIDPDRDIAKVEVKLEAVLLQFLIKHRSKP